MKKEIAIAVKAMVTGALDWEMYLGPVSAIFMLIIQYWFGEVDLILNLLVCMIVVDFLTGLIKAAIRRELSSRRMSAGFLRKVGKFLIVGLVVQIGKVIGMPFIRTIIMGGYITNEFLSIIENGEACGVIPHSIAKMLLQYQDKLSDLFNIKLGGE